MTDIGGMDAVVADQIGPINKPTLTERIDKPGTGCTGLAGENVTTSEYPGRRGGIDP